MQLSMYIEVTAHVHGTGMMTTATTVIVVKAKMKAMIADSGNISDSNNGVDNDGNGSHEDQYDSGNANDVKDNGGTDFDNNDEDVDDDEEDDGNNDDNDDYFNRIMVITVFAFCYYSDQLVEKSPLSQNCRIQLIKCKEQAFSVLRPVLGKCLSPTLQSMGKAPHQGDCQ